MKTRKTNLLLLCDSYPITEGEYFIDDEIKILAENFSKIVVVVKDQKSSKGVHFIPDNLKVYTYSNEFSNSVKMRSLFKVFSNLFIVELYYVLFKYSVTLRPILVKIIFNYIYASGRIISTIESIIKENNFSMNETVFYSYWHDEKAFALARMAHKNNNMCVLSRAHGSDIYADAQKFVSHACPYLPFKKFILKNLRQTFTVSQHGKNHFLTQFGDRFESKVSVSKLGKINQRIPIFEKTTPGVLFCSCSSIIPVKRLNLIIEVLSQLSIENFSWIHFGDGALHKDIENYAFQKIPHINFAFKGSVRNQEILDFYSNNYVDLFINLSLSEGIPVSIMEALSAGIPILATEVGGTPEVVPENVGFLLAKDFCVADASKIIEKYFLLSKEDKIKYRKNAYNYWDKNFNAERNYTDFYNTITKL